MSETVITAKNGVKIYTYKNSAQHGFQMSVFVRAGSMYEKKGEGGITHFLEHILIRNVASMMDGKLYAILDMHGLELGASTYSEMVQFSLFGAREKLPIAAEILCKIFCPITLTRAEIDAERNRIKAEIRESGDRTSLASFTNSIVHKGTTLSESIAGSIASVNALTRRRLESYRRSIFTRENVFVYLTGGITDEDVSMVAKSLDVYELPSCKPRMNIAPIPTDFGKRAGSVYIKSGDFTMIRFTFDLDMARLSVAEADLLYDVLLSGNNSRLFLELSERLGYCYDVAGNLERYKNIGTLSVYYELREAHLYDATERTIDILKRLKSALIPDTECMKSGYVTNAGMLLDDVRELNFTFAYDNHIMDLGYSDVFDRADTYDKITPQRLREVAEEIFRPENLTLTIKGNKRRIDRERLIELIKEF